MEQALLLPLLSLLTRARSLRGLLSLRHAWHHYLLVHAIQSHSMIPFGRHPSVSRERQRERERRLAARMVQSEDARIEVEAEAGRLQAFLDEMRKLGPPFATPPRRGSRGGEMGAAD